MTLTESNRKRICNEFMKDISMKRETVGDLGVQDLDIIIQEASESVKAFLDGLSAEIESKVKKKVPNQVLLGILVKVLLNA